LIAGYITSLLPQISLIICAHLFVSNPVVAIQDSCQIFARSDQQMSLWFSVAIRWMRDVKQSNPRIRSISSLSFEEGAAIVWRTLREVSQQKSNNEDKAKLNSK